MSEVQIELLLIATVVVLYVRALNRAAYWRRVRRTERRSG